MANNEGFSAVGTKMSFSVGVPATKDLAGMQGITDYVEWDRLSNIGDIGGEDSVLEWTPVGTGDVEKILTNRNNGDQDMTAAHVPDNPGQVVFVGAYQSRTTLSVKEELSSGEILYYRAIPKSDRISVGDASGMLMINPKMAVTGSIFVDSTDLN